MINAYAQTASFRIPENHTFQQSLPLPPITTLTGIMGAALGLSCKDALEYKDKHKVGLGVSGEAQGEMKDLWRYNKIKASPKSDGSDRQDILIREFLTDISITVAFGCEKHEVITELFNAFKDPVYALTFGNSDDIFKTRTIAPVKESRLVLCKDFKNTVLRGDFGFEYDSIIDLKNTPITHRIRAPQVFILPTGFSFKGEERRVSKREYFTFVGSQIRLKDSLSVFGYDDEYFMLL
ncbi:MAG: CRISPR-associated protein Cas5 [Candidatus Xenobiia bacterium LiM19]